MGGSRSVWDLHLNNNVPMDMKVELGAGRVQLTLGTLSLTNLEVEMGAGETVVDLTGDWKNDLSARIRGGVGRVKIRLPRDVGVRVEPEGRIGAVNARDLRRDGRVYVNDAYRKSDVTLRIDVKGGVGETHLELSDTSPVV
jgi:predicted membrane protein